MIKTGKQAITGTAADLLKAFLKSNRGGVVRSGNPAPTTLLPGRGVRACPFQPVLRPPMATLWILDDGCAREGEPVRIRRDRLVIGRERGDVLIPFDRAISSEHVELRCYWKNGQAKWRLADLGSSNGTYVRCQSASLVRSVQMIIGGRHYLFRLPQKAGNASAGEEDETREIPADQEAPIDQLFPRLTCVSDEHAWSRLLEKPRMRLGRGSRCELLVEDDEFLGPHDVMFTRGRNGIWTVKDLRSVNGLWIRVQQIELEKTTEFQAGEQRFRFCSYVPSREKDGSQRRRKKSPTVVSLD